MSRRLAGSIGRASVLAVAALVVMIPALPASAAAASLPKTKLNVKSVDWHNRTGTVAVTARVKCKGKGTYSWQVSLTQHHARDRGSAKVPCDGDGFASTIVLDAKKGRFHPGPADFAHGSITCGEDACIGFLVGEKIRISPR
jgi:hypothetical protein